MLIRFRSCIFLISLAATAPAADLLQLFSHRATVQSREAARLHAGSPAGTQDAIDRTLAFLATQQGKDGAWGEHRQVAMTSFALLAFLGNGVTPLTEEYGELLTGGIMSLVDVSTKGRGRLRTVASSPPSPLWPLEHALATQALAESLLVCRQLAIKLPGLNEAVVQAAQWTIDHQHRDGGWAYGFSEGSARGPDDWITVPALHALWLAHRAGVETRNLEGAVRGTLGHMQKRQTENGAIQFPVLANRPGAPMTGGCAFAFQIASEGKHPSPHKALKFVSKRDEAPFQYRGDTPASDLQYLHYDALARWHHGGKTWKEWQEPRLVELLKHQAADGSFAPQNDNPRRHPKDAAIKRSSLACLILQTPWRYHLEK